MRVATQSSRRRSGLAFTLVELMVAVAIMGVVFIALYAGIAHGYASIGMARENLRATQILLEKSETLRLYTWDQVTTNAFPVFTASYYVNAAGKASGVTYVGSFGVTNVADSKLPDKGLKDANYDTDMRVVTITLTWTNGNLRRQRSLSTLVSANGLHDYVY